MSPKSEEKWKELIKNYFLKMRKGFKQGQDISIFYHFLQWQKKWKCPGFEFHKASIFGAP